MARVRPAGEDIGLDGGLWSSFPPPSEAERLQVRKVQQNTETQLLVKILQERNRRTAPLRGGAAWRT